MPVKVKCSTCDKVLSVPDAARGKAVKCPQCQTRIAVPAEVDVVKPGPKATATKARAKKPAKPLDSEAALATFDMRRAEDTEARICSKCGFDMKYQDEEDTECPQCGYDAEAGGMGVKARKKAMKGPDPADFYPGLFKQSWKFVGRNQKLAWRSVIYTLVCLVISMMCAFLYLWISMWPPRIFLALCFFISFLVIPGWMWFLDVEIIKLTLERKDKFKKLNFDFFLASAMGAAFVFWCAVVVVPLLSLPAALGYLLVNYGGMPQIVLPICIGLGVIPAVWMLPVVMSHMAMPVQFKGWLVWKVVPMWARNLKPLTIWLLFAVVTNIPIISGAAVIAAVYGQDIALMVRTMEDNADIARKKFAQIQNPNTKKKGQAAVVPVALADPKAVDFKPLIVPAVILVVMSVINGFTGMFNMRTNGQFTYYHKNSLEMVDKLKEYKYIAKEKRSEDDDEKPKTAVQQLIDAFVFMMVFDLVGLVGGMLYGSMTDAGPGKGIFFGLCIGSGIALVAACINGAKAAFQENATWGMLVLLFYPVTAPIFAFKKWEERQTVFFQYALTSITCVVLVIAGFATGIFSTESAPAAPSGQSQQPEMPGGAAGMPGGAAMPGMPGGPAMPGMPVTPPAAPAGKP
jgi:DNA-directed RNA polymerase subunit RPC12/RpoP